MMLFGKKAKAISAALMLGASVFMAAGCGGGDGASGGAKEDKIVARKEVKTPALKEVKYGKDKISAKIYKLEWAGEIPEFMSERSYVVGNSLFALGKGKTVYKIDFQDEKITGLEAVLNNISETVATADDNAVFYRVGRKIYSMDTNKKVNTYGEPKKYLNLMRVRGDKDLVYYTANGDRDNIYKGSIADGKITENKKFPIKDFIPAGNRGNYSDGTKLYIATRTKVKDNNRDVDVAAVNVIDTKTDKGKIISSYAEEAGTVKGRGAKTLQNNPTLALTANYIVFHDNGSCNRIRIMKRSTGKYIDDIATAEFGIKKIRAITAIPGTNDIIAIGFDNNEKWGVYRIDI